MPVPKPAITRVLSAWARRCQEATALLGCLCTLVVAAPAQPPTFPEQPWGRLTTPTNAAGRIRLEVSTWPTDGKLRLPRAFPEIVAASVSGVGGNGTRLPPGPTPLEWVLADDGTQSYLPLGDVPATPAPTVIWLETADRTGQLDDGRIVFSAGDARVTGVHTNLESSPGDPLVGRWTDARDTVSWEFRPTRWGKYDFELAYAAEGGAARELEVEIAGRTFQAGVAATGSWQRYRTLPVGRVYLATADPFTVRLRALKVMAGAGLNLKALILRPAPEGDPIVQEAAGNFRLRARDAIVHGVMMRYEPLAIKNCLGYWMNPADWAEWRFKVSKPGTFKLEVVQGCGKGQGGSDVAVEVAGQRLEFVVEETGHFQIVIPRALGWVTLPAAGDYSLAIRPRRKQAAAIMDIREVRLTPSDPPSQPQFPGKRSLWFGFQRYDFEVDGRPVVVVAPQQAAPGRPWAWHGEFFGHKPAPDLALLGRGFHVVYMSVPDMLGCPEAVARWNAFYQELTGRYGLARQAALVGLSRGGLYVYNWAAANPDKVACIYADAPVCDFKSWPGGKGHGPGSARDWQLVLDRYHFKSEAEALAYNRNPVDNLAGLAAAKVPLLHVYGDADEVVPWEENTGLLAERYRQLGGSITLIRKPGGKHHPHGLDDSTPIIDFIWQHAANAQAQAWLAHYGGGPLDEHSHPLIRRQGTIDLDLVETTPVVFQGRLYRFEWVREGYWNNQRHTNYFRFIDHETGKATAPFADGHEFGSAFVEGGTAYVTGTRGRDRVDLFVSEDLEHWTSRPVLQNGRYGIFNTSLWKAGHEYVLMFEIDRPPEEAGTPFTARFAKSPDLQSWTLTPPECNYAKDRYTAPHCLRWLEGWFYDFYLEAHDGYEMRVVRSRDLIHWEPSPLNPVLRADPEDKVIANPALTEAQRTRIAHAVNLNNSDIDFCEWQGRLILNYSWGNQQGVEHLAEAVYDGTLAQFLHGWFPE